MSTLLGELACLGAAAVWAFSLTLFRGPIAAHGSVAVNLVKCAVATLLLGGTTLALGQLEALTGASPAALIFLAASGVVGLSLGDNALFAAVHRLGVHRTLLLQTTAPIFTALLAWGWKGVIPTGPQLLAAVVILVGVALVVAPSRGESVEADGADHPAPLSLGVAFAVLAALGQGFGIVLAKEGMSEVSVIPAATFRLGAAALGLFLLAIPGGGLGRTRALLTHRPSVKRVMPATFLGSYLAMMLMMAGIAFAPAAIAAVLLGTTPIFSLLVESAEQRRLPDLRPTAGTLVAVVGVAALALLSA
ncbi:MAG: DMT family transporter [Deltaproteobacteria bacterium]|nr:DMT family transporter [Deltaproteobacteria bacterium]